MTRASSRQKVTRYTRVDYQSWPEDERWELIDGKAYAMSPSPGMPHQEVLGNLFAALKSALRGSKCKPVLSPMDVHLSDDTILQPDLLIVCNPSLIKQHIEGSPTLVVEILSDSSIAHDRIAKMEIYARYGVKEYWIITPFPGVVEIYKLTKRKFTGWKIFGRTDTLTSPSFPGLKIKLEEIFDIQLDTNKRKLLIIKEPPGRYGRKS
jgi:Uma2 family endonuclease